MVIQHEGQLFTIFSVDHRTPGNKRGSMQTRMKNLKNGTMIDYRFRAEEFVDRAILDEVEFEYLYNEGDDFHFMNTETYEQMHLSRELLGDTVYYLIPNTVVIFRLRSLLPRKRQQEEARKRRPGKNQGALVFEVRLFFPRGTGCRSLCNVLNLTKHARENRIHIAKLPLQIKSMRQPLRIKILCDPRIACHALPKIRIRLPRRHRVFLHRFVPVVARHTFFHQVLQQLS